MDLLFLLRRYSIGFSIFIPSTKLRTFPSVIFGFIANNGRGRLTDLYQSSASQTQYWSFPKFLSRGKWHTDAVAALLIRCLQHLFEDWVYVYDETKALKTGKTQWGYIFSATSVIKSIA